MEFIGREQELEILQRRLDEVRDAGTGALMALRGRRRVGKSRLVEEFARASGSPYVFYTATKESGVRELNRFVDALSQSEAPAARSVSSGLRPETWEAALELAATGASQQTPLIVVIDEFPYLAESEPGVEAILQKVWDRTFQRQPVLILMIGSDEAMMAALNEQGRPLYDRVREMAIHPLTPADIAAMLQLAAVDAIDAYLVIGGFPVLALEWGTGRGLREYLTDALTDPTSFLVVSAERALSAELPGIAQARAVLSAIGAGSRAHRAIGSETGIAATGLDDALGTLRGKRIVERTTPYSTKSAPKTVLWEITDPYMRFWLRFISKRIDLIERDRGRLLVDEFERSWATFRGGAVEHIVRASVERLLPDPQFGSAARYVGGYWNRTGSVEVDLVGGDHRPVAKRLGFLGSIKWRVDRPFDRSDAADLAGKRRLVPGATSHTKLVAVGSQGFEDDGALDVRLGPKELLAAWTQ